MVNGLAMQRIDGFHDAAKDNAETATQLGAAAQTLTQFGDATGVGQLYGAKDMATACADARQTAATEITTASQGVQTWANVNNQLFSLSDNLVNVSTDTLNTVIANSGGD